MLLHHQDKIKNRMTSITPSSYQVNEGESLTTSLSGFTPGSTLFFKVGGRGVSKKDFAAGGVKGKVQVDANGVATISHTLRADKATEGDESFAIQVFSDKKMRNLLGQSDAVTVFDTSAKAGKRPKSGNVPNDNTSKDAPKDIITGIWRNDGEGWSPNWEEEGIEGINAIIGTGVFEGGKITNGRFRSIPRILERDSTGEKFRGELYLDKNDNKIFDAGDHQFGWYWEYEVGPPNTVEDESNYVIFQGGASESGTWVYQRGNSELDMFDPLLPGQKHAGPIFITDPSVF